MSSGWIDLPEEGSASWKDPVANAAALPALGNSIGDARVAKATSAIYVWDGAAWQLVGPGAGGGTVTSVGLSLPPDFTVSGSPVVGAGTLTAVYASQPANFFLASPSGGAGVPVFRAVVAADIPDLPAYAKLAGRAGGQTLNGDTAASGSLVLSSTANATKGKIFLGTASAYDQNIDVLGLGITSPTGLAGTHLHLHSAAANPGSLIHFTNNSTGTANTNGTFMGFHQNSSVFSIDQLAANKIWLKIQGTFAWGVDESRNYGNAAGGIFTAVMDHTGSVRLRSFANGLLTVDGSGNVSVSSLSLPLSVANGGTGQTDGTLHDNNFFGSQKSVDFYNRALWGSDGFGGTANVFDWSALTNIVVGAQMQFSDTWGLTFTTRGAGSVAGTASLGGGGTVTVNTTSVHNASIVVLSRKGTSTRYGILRYENVVDGTSFDITSSDAGDDGQVDWIIFQTV